MKTTTVKLKGDDSVIQLLEKVPGLKSSKGAKTLAAYHIETIAQFSGAIQPVISISNRKDLKEKQLTCTLTGLRKALSQENSISKIRETLNISRHQASIIFNLFQNIEQSTQVYNFNFNWSLGTKKRDRRIQSSLYWKKTKPIQIKKSSKYYLIPDYHAMGNVFDQGTRGTCLTNAACSLIDYKSSARFSRQFLYHQCKMIDGIMNQEGTFIETPFELLVEDNYSDHGCITESTWSYNPNKSKTEHQGPPPETAFCSLRVIADEVVAARKSNMHSDIIRLLQTNIAGKTCPVVIGIPLYESFFSPETTRTGKLTMPLPGETIIGYHAMLIVGYDQNRGVFLTRNSWSSAWASENDSGYAGHAWIPFEYIQKFCFSAITTITISTEYVTVREEERLYFRNQNSLSQIHRKAASNRTTTKTRVNRNQKPHASRQINTKRKKMKGYVKLIFAAVLYFLADNISHGQLTETLIHLYQKVGDKLMTDSTILELSKNLFINL